jgi:hypothetical protein
VLAEPFGGRQPQHLFNLSEVDIAAMAEVGAA